MNIEEYLDFHASRFVYLGTRRRMDDLHALKNLAQHLAILRARQEAGQKFVNGEWVKKEVTPCEK